MAPTGEFLDPAMVIFAALAVFICWKLRSVLGVRVDRDTPPPGHFQTSYSSPMPQATIAPAQKLVREAARRWNRGPLQATAATVGARRHRLFWLDDFAAAS